MLFTDPISQCFQAKDVTFFRLDPTDLRRGDPNDMIPVTQDTIVYPLSGITKSWGLHIKVKVPSGMRATHIDRDLKVSDLFDLNNGGQYVRYGSQFADYVFMAISEIVSAKPPGCAPLQDSLTYTEPLIPQPFSQDMLMIARKAKADEERRKFEEAEKAKHPKVAVKMTRSAGGLMPVQSLSARVKIKKRTDQYV